MSEVSSRTSSSGLVRLTETLSARDWLILGFLATHRFATTVQLRLAFFAEHVTPVAAARACIRVLDRHLGHRLVGRLERRVGGIKHGSSSFVWHLDVTGHRLMTRDQKRRPYSAPSPDFLDHTLAVVDAHIALRELARSGAVVLEKVEVEAEAWRPYLTGQGTTTILKPDLYAHLSTPDYDDHWYIEIDRGTESLPVLLAKCRAYAAYRATGRAQAEHGVFPRVLWVLPTERRVAALRAAVQADAQLDSRLFLAVTAAQLTAVLTDPDTNHVQDGARS